MAVGRFAYAAHKLASLNRFNRFPVDFRFTFWKEFTCLTCYLP
jgi:hypothetical protein